MRLARPETPAKWVLVHGAPGAVRGAVCKSVVRGAALLWGALVLSRETRPGTDDFGATDL